MLMQVLRRLGAVLAPLALVSLWAEQALATIVRFDTTQGSFDVQLFDSQTPLTVQNFLNYVAAGDYNNTLFHRSVPGFVEQAGELRSNGTAIVNPNNYPAIPTFAPVKNEPGISNTIGTIAMAKVPGNPNSATSQFFFNLGDNASNLDNQNGGFTVFGKILGNGLSVLNKVSALPTYDFASKTVNPAAGGVPLDGFSSASLQSGAVVPLASLQLINSVQTISQFTFSVSSDLRLLGHSNKMFAAMAEDKDRLETSTARNTPHLVLYNNSGLQNITSFSFQLQDPNHYIDEFRTASDPTAVSVARADAVAGGSKTLKFNFTKPLTPGSSMVFQIDLDRTDGSQAMDDFRNVLFRPAGTADTSQNAKITVNFSDGTSVVQTLGNNGLSSLSSDLYQFSGKNSPGTTHPLALSALLPPGGLNGLATSGSSSTGGSHVTPLSGSFSDLGGGSLGTIATVPEPSSLALAGLGVAFLCGMKRLRRKAGNCKLKNVNCKL